MSSSQRFTNELARLVWLLVYRATHVEDQKRALRVMLPLVRDEDHRINHIDVAAAVSQGVKVKPQAEEVPWLSELGTRMAGHGVRGIEVLAGARAPEMLGLARALAAPENPEDEGAAFDRAILALGFTTIAVHLGRSGFVRTPTPPQGMRAYGARPARTPSVGTTPVAEAVAELAPQATALTLPAAFPAARRSLTPAGNLMQQDLMPTGMAGDLVMRLRGDLTPETAPIVLDEVSRLLEDASRYANWTEVLDIATRVMEREATLTNVEVKRAFSIHLKRLAKPGILRGVAQLLPRHKELRDNAQAFIHRYGDAAADALIDLLVASESSTERRAYRDAVRKCPSAVEPLMHLLRDDRWYVVRNAAELLGEMMAVEADQELINVLRHRDARARHSAMMSLIRLGTPRAIHEIIRLLGDADPSVRQKAALGLGRVTSPRVAPALLEALTREQDEAVQHALLSALGNHPVEEAVQRLVKESGPGPLLKRRPVARRLVAVQALGQASTDAARTALRDLLRDRDKAVRELADRMLSDQEPEIAVRH